MAGFFCRSLIICLLFLLAMASAAVAKEDYRNSIILYGAKYTPDKLGDIFLNSHETSNSYLAALAWNREFSRSFGDLGWETEIQAVKHFGGQHHLEFNALVVARWHRFPWNRRIATTVAVGEGLSLATRTPQLERDNHTRVNALLNYLLFELTLAPPQSRWYWSGRIHHRSGVYGLFDGVHGASNFIGTGLGYRF